MGRVAPSQVLLLGAGLATCVMMRVVYLLELILMRTVVQFTLGATVTASAVSVSDSTPGVRVTWRTTLPPECVTSVRVEFRTTTNSVLVATYTATNTSQTEVVQTGLQCATSYYIRVVVTGEPRYRGIPEIQSLFSSQLRVLVGGKEILCVHKISITVT